MITEYILLLIIVINAGAYVKYDAEHPYDTKDKCEAVANELIPVTKALYPYPATVLHLCVPVNVESV